MIRSGMKRFSLTPFPFVFPLAMIVLTCCHTPTADVIRSERQKYNSSVKQTNDEQLLLNIVRLAYSESIFFLSVMSVTSSYSTSFSESLSFSESWDPTGAGSKSLSVPGSVSVSFSPNVTYTPVQGPDYVKKLLSPISLQVIHHLLRSGWSLARIFRITTQFLNFVPNAPSSSRPTTSHVPDFQEFIDAIYQMRNFQRFDDITFKYVTVTDENIPIILLQFSEKTQITERKYPLLKKLGYNYKNRTLMLTDRPIAAAQIADQPTTQTPEAASTTTTPHQTLSPTSTPTPSPSHPPAPRATPDLVTGQTPGTVPSQSPAPRATPDLVTGQTPGTVPSRSPIPGATPDLVTGQTPGTVSSQSPASGATPDLVTGQTPGTVPSLSPASGATPHLVTGQTSETAASSPPPFDKSQLVFLQSRTILGIMYYFSKAVDIPPEDRERKLVDKTIDSDGTVFDWTKVTGGMMSIKSSETYPGNAFVAVYYRRHWFYIANNDLDSKDSFSLLTQLVAFQDESGTVAPPTFTIGIGAGR